MLNNDWLNAYPDRDTTFNPANSGYNIGPKQFKTYDQLYDEGLGRPNYVPGGNSGIMTGEINPVGPEIKGSFRPNAQMLAKYPTYDIPESPFSNFTGAFKDLAPFAAMAGAGGWLNGAFGAGAGATGGGLGDIWGTEGLGGNFPSNWTLPGTQVAGTAGGMPTAEWMKNFGSWNNAVPNTGGNMGTDFNWSSNTDMGNYNPFDSGGNTLRDLSSGPGKMNLQDLMTRLDSTPQGQALLNKLTEGGATDAAGKMSMLSKLFGGFGNNTGISGDYSFPFGKVLGGLLESYGANKQRSSLQSSLDKSLDYADPFHFQRPLYQGQFRGLTQDPSNFFRDPAISSAVNFEDQATSRKLASQGYNMSGNFASDVAQARMREAFKQYMPYTKMIGDSAGAFTGPGISGSIAANTGTQIAGLGPQILGGLGSAVNDATTGAQPSYLEQIFGKGMNKNLWQALTQQGAA